MNLQLKNIALLLVLLLIAGGVYSQGFLKTDGKKIVTASGENVLLRGIGLGGWMLQEGYMLRINKEGQQYRIRQRIEALLSKAQTQEFYDVWLSNFVTHADIDSLKVWGFNSVRLPMHYNLYTLPADEEPVPGKNTWLSKGFALTDSLVKWCKANNMYLILDLHAAPGGQGNDLNISDRDPAKPSLWESDANRQKTIALWQQLAKRYANETTIAGYDILNEPNWGFADTATDKHGQKEQVNAPLKSLLQDITKAIREVDKNHIIIIEGNSWGNNYNGILNDGLWDKNMVLSFHKYWDNNDAKSIAHILKYRDQYNVPVWLGETGENSNLWYTDAVHLLEENNIGWAWWPLKKLGNNNPLQIKSNLNYDALVDYWNGKREKPPKESNVYSGLLELATYTNIYSNTVHRDVIDALLRQPHTNETKPFKPNTITAGTTVNAVDYDLGKNGVAYYDKDAANYRSSTGDRNVGNRGYMYRNDGVDIYKDSSKYEQYYVGNIEDEEWLQYTINVTEAGRYNIVLKVAAATSESAVTIVDGDAVLAKNLNILNTSDGKKWQAVTVKNIVLNKGKHKIKIIAEKGGFNFAGMGFLK